MFPVPFLSSSLLFFPLFLLFVVVSAQPSSLDWSLTSRNLEYALSSADPLAWQSASLAPPSSNYVVSINSSKTFQTIVGIGNSLEASTCYNMYQLSSEDRATVMQNLFDPDKGIGMSLMRITIGTSDFTPLPFYSYDDQPEGQTDPSLSDFSIAQDQDYIIPCIKEALSVASTDSLQVPTLYASPWSAPGWMKSDGKMEGGHLQEQYYDTYAQYLLKFLQSYEEEGIHVSAITPQNEPMTQTSDYPSSLLLPEQEAELVGKYLGPLLANNTQTDIWCYDHNFDFVKYPETVLSDPDAFPYVEGTGFHNYGGKPDQMTHLHEDFPSKSIYFTEGSVFGVKGAVQIINFFRNWARSYNAWVTMLDQDGEPNAGPFHAGATMIQLNTTSLEVKYRFEYYMYGQFSKYIRPGALRIDSEFNMAGTGVEDLLSNVAFLNPDGSTVLVATNTHTEPISFQIALDGQYAVNVDFPCAECVATFVWSNSNPSPAAALK